MATIARSDFIQLIDKVLEAELPSDDFHFEEDIAPGKFKYALPLRITHKYDESAFDEEELQRLHHYLKSVREYLFAEVQLTETQTQAIDERLAYLGQTALRQSKQDWAHIATGTIFTIAMSLSLDRDRAEKLLAMTSDFLNTIFRRLLT